VFARPAHPYTRALMAAVPVPDPEVRHEAPPVRGEAPSAIAPPPGCPFHPRCLYAIEACKQIVPPLEPVPQPGAPAIIPDPTHVAACIRKHEI